MSPSSRTNSTRSKESSGRACGKHSLSKVVIIRYNYILRHHFRDLRLKTCIFNRSFTYKRS